MPELPEVQALAERLTEAVGGAPLPVDQTRRFDGNTVLRGQEPRVDSAPSRR